MNTSDTTKSNPENKAMDILKHIQEEIAMVVPDYEDFLLMQIMLSKPYQISYEIFPHCPEDKENKIVRVIQHNAKLLDLPVSSIDDIE